MHQPNTQVRRNCYWNVIGLLCAGVIGPITAAASDGRLEINQDCVASGCFPGDAPGFPVTIPQPGSYILTSNLDLTSEDTPEDVTAIVIHNESVVIDLNGFRIMGPNFCTGTPVTSCDSPGTGDGISSSNNNITVRNGLIQGMGDIGIDVVSGALIEDMHIFNCAGDGLTVGGGSRVVNNSVQRNGGRGIATAGRGLISSNVINGNLGVGLETTNSAYSNNAISQNTGGDVSGGLQIGGNMCGVVACP